MNSKSPLESLKTYAAILAVGYGVFSQPLAVADVRLDMLLKGERDVYFLGLDPSVRADASKEDGSGFTRSTPAVCLCECKSSEAGFVDAAYPVDFEQGIEGSYIDHSELDIDSVDRAHSASAIESLVDCDAAFSVKESREVDIVFFHQGPRKISGELGGHPMPGPSQDAEGQYRTKQAERPGVCNEQGPDPKGKVCSELMGNHENETETISSCVEDTTQGNRSDYQKTCNVPVRFVRPGGQGSSADVTWEALEYMGRPWYWDRQCPTGRAYFIRTDDTYFMVDPRFLFKWTGDLTYPDQMAFTRLCGLRFFLKTDRRMFEAVVDGVTA